MGELGSGFMLATHDLEIRGAGELLGEEQSGQIEEVGFTLYADQLAAAVRSLKAGALDDAPLGAAACEVDLGVSALLPDDYIPDVHTRLVLYKRLAEARDAPALDDLGAEMVDRFGPLPPAAQRLVEAMRVRVQAQALGVGKVRAGARGLTLDFEARARVDPRALIELVQTQGKAYRLEGQRRLHHHVALDAAETRAPAASALLATLSGTPA
jgi:transcription-repair coupling factor (superfamily II helicase)